MTSIDETGSPSAQPEVGAEGLYETMLQTEINFWRDLIECSEEAQTPECLERMQQAMALAQSRLQGLCDSRAAPLDPGGADRMQQVH